jgi:S1-C subfamily serine protease
MWKKILIVTLSPFLVGLMACTVSYKATGAFEDFNEVLMGHVAANLATGGGKVRVEGQNSKIRCEGVIPPPTYIPNLLSCAGQRGDATLRCSDGRRLDLQWVASSCTRGYGEGADQNGARFWFVFGYNDAEARREIEKMAAAVASHPSLPAYRPKEHRESKGYATGTGFFVTADGVLVTNYHVIEGASQITVLHPASGTEFPGRVLKVDPVNDVAVIKIDAPSTPLPLASNCTAMKGDEVFTLGYPMVALQGQEQKATFGRVNALSGIGDDIRLVQIDVPVQPGNSGGPLINRRGEAIGVVTATLSQLVALRESGALPQNVNFAVKIDYILPLLRSAASPESLSAVSPNTGSEEFSRLVAQGESSVVLVIAK